MSNPQTLSFPTLEKVAHRFLILSEPIRLQLIQLLMGGERCVGELVEATKGTQGNISRHLNILHNEGILGRRKGGISVYYFIADKSVTDLCKMVCKELES